MALKINLEKVENNTLMDKVPICNKPIIILTQTEHRIYPSGQIYTRSWVIGEAKQINQENKRKPAEKKITDNFTNITEQEEF